MPTRLTHLITSLEGGGSENYLHQIISHSPPGFEHRVFYLKSRGVIGQRLEAMGVPVRRVQGSWDLFRELSRNPPDLLHTLLYRGHQVGRLIGRLAGIHPIVSSQQAIDTWQSPWLRWLDRWTMRFCDCVIVNSSAVYRLMERRRAGRLRPKLVWIENGVELDRFKMRNRLEARRIYGLPEQSLVGGALMRLHAEKGADLIPAIAERILRDRPELHLIIGGVGSMEPMLRHRTQGRPWSARLHWAGWQEDPPLFLSALDFFWLLSREESFSQALVEASIMGLPWAAPDVGGVRELIDAGAAGLLFEKENVALAAESLNKLISQLASYRSKAKAAIPSLRERYSVEKMVRLTYEIFSKQPER